MRPFPSRLGTHECFPHLHTYSSLPLYTSTHTHVNHLSPVRELPLECSTSSYTHVTHLIPTGGGLERFPHPHKRRPPFLLVWGNQRCLPHSQLRPSLSAEGAPNDFNIYTHVRPLFSHMKNISAFQIHTQTYVSSSLVDEPQTNPLHLHTCVSSMIGETANAFHIHTHTRPLRFPWEDRNAFRVIIHISFNTSFVHR